MKIIATRATFPLFFILLALGLHAQTLRGTVRDASGGEVLAGADLLLTGQRDSIFRTAISDEKGAFLFEDLRPGYYTLKVNYGGFRPMVLREINIAGGKESVLDIAYNQNVDLPLLTIVNTSDRRPVQPLGEMPLTREQTLRFPATFFDPARLAMAYPGVMNNDDQANGMVIRGNSPASLRWRLEGVDIVNPNHLTNAGTFGDRPTAAAGGVLMFSAQLLDNSSLLTGSYPAGYGEAIGGVMDMNLRSGNNRQHEFTAQAGLIGLDLAAEGPLSQRENGSYLVNYRYSTVGLLGQMGVSFGDEDIRFQDLSFKLHFTGNRGGEWSLFGLGGLSKNIFTHKTDSAEVEAFKDFFDIDYSSKTGIIGISHQLPLSRRGWIKFTAAASGQSNERTSVSDAFEDFDSSDDLDESKISGAAMLSYRFGPQIRLMGGAMVNRQRYSANSTDRRMPLERIEHTFATAQPWLSLYWKSKSEKTLVNAGLHSLFFPYKDRSALEPRVSITQTLTPGHRLTVSGGLFSQVAPLWLSKDALDLLRSWQTGLRYSWNAENEWTLSGELFYQKTTETGVDAGFASSYSLLNESEYNIFEGKMLLYGGLGRNAGIELNAERYLSDGWFLLLNTTLFKSEYRGSDEVWRSTRWDSRRIINVTAGKEWQRDKRPGQVRSFGLNGRIGLAGGLRAMPIDVAASEAAGMTVFDAGEGFSVQQKDYFRLDIRIYWKRSLGDRRNSTFAMDFQNATMQENEAYRYYDPFTLQVETKKQLGLIPNISWRLEF